MRDGYPSGHYASQESAHRLDLHDRWQRAEFSADRRPASYYTVSVVRPIYQDLSKCQASRSSATAACSAVPASLSLVSRTNVTLFGPMRSLRLNLLDLFVNGGRQRQTPNRGYPFSWFSVCRLGLSD